MDTIKLLMNQTLLVYCLILNDVTFCAEPVAKKATGVAFLCFEQKELSTEETDLFRFFFRDDIDFITNLSEKNTYKNNDVVCAKIYADANKKELVGMTLFQSSHQDLHIDYLLIKEKFQKQGYGKEIILGLFEKYQPQAIQLYLNGSEAAKSFYKSLDFNPVDGEEDLIEKINPSNSQTKSELDRKNKNK